MAAAKFRQRALDGPGVPTIDETAYGYTIGAGVDFAWTPNFIVRAEYLFSDYDTERYDYRPFGGGTIDSEHRTHTLRAAAIWRFATGKAPAAVMTRY